MIHIKKNIPLSRYTSFGIGGPADCFIEAAGPIEIAESIEFAEREKLTYFVMGGGTNLLFSDTGYRGLVIRISDGGLAVHGSVIQAGSGITLKQLTEEARDQGLSGMENLAGIPGSLGGAVRGNAGAFGTEIGDLIKRVKAFNRETSMVQEFSREQCCFSYRNSLFKQDDALIILSAEIELTAGAVPQTIGRAMEKIIATRESKHSQSAKCAGSFFMNPEVSDAKLREEFAKDTGSEAKNEKLPAGWLIDHVGLRGKYVGGAQVSDQHPNYIINTGDATAEDVIMLSSLIKRKVRDELNVRLREEVQMVGF
ncbi:MAG: UDP-N-acetylmuramate dehydrogenase [Candidatus Moranbacteria bacterium]|nr:UDP-N-acetylmuramate dehydrogenase [Candidatus Moranbacteria bacterium]MBP6034385.1 UDP-N-acetylmuramate dehydrogenase [Candidatus Moranbacteria bacterium]MBP7695773.1 UDP-N-acetylmuramate dehydrogenase [Candidatus Moranbacteria bacterium]